MEQKKKEKDVLIVRDEKTGEIGVVAGLGKDGNPKLSPPKAENKGDFLHFDKHSNPLETFLSNFYRQCKEPKRFGFYRVAAEGVEDLIEVFKELLKDPEANKDLLKQHRVDTSPYEQQVQATSEEMKSAPDDLNPFWQAVEDHWFPDGKEVQLQEQVEQSQEQEQAQEQVQEQPQEQAQDVQTAQEKSAGQTFPIDESRISWSELEIFYGVSRQGLEASGDLGKMLNGGKSGLMTVMPIIAGERFEIEARLSFKEMADGTMGLVPHTIRKEPKLDEEFMGITFTAEDKANLKNTGNLGRVADVLDKTTGEIIPSYISIDRITNEIEAIPVKSVPITSRIGRTEFSEQEISELRAGRAIPNKEIVMSDTRKFKATLQVNVERGGVEFVPRQAKQKQSQNNRQGASGQNNRQESPQVAQQSTQQTTKADGEPKPKIYKHQWEDENGNIRAPRTLGTVILTPEQQQKFSEGKAILVKDMVRDGQDQPYTAFVKYSHEAGKPKYYRNNPDVAQKQVVAPAAESRTQVAVNTDGKTNEATKHLQKPLQQGQAAPANKQQQEQQEKPQRQNKPKGVKR